MARPPGSKNKFSAGQMAEGLGDGGIDWIQETIELFRTGDDRIKFAILKMWAEYLYAKRRAEDDAGNPEEPLFGAVPLTNDDFIDLIKKTREAK